MKNKINKSIRLATLLIATSFLNSCNETSTMKNGIISTSKKRKMELQVEVNGKLSRDQYKTEKAEMLCKDCGEGRVGLFKFSNDNQGLVLLCEECNSIWTDPNNIKWGEAVSDKVLESHFGVQDSEDLFKKGSGWATKEEIEKDARWASLLKSNKVVIEDIE